MPGGDRKGPLGQGPNTGRGAGYCTGNDRAGFESAPGRGGGRGIGGGLGRGLGRGRGGPGRGLGRGGGIGLRDGSGQGLGQGAGAGSTPQTDDLGVIRQTLGRLESAVASLIERLDKRNDRN